MGVNSIPLTVTLPTELSNGPGLITCKFSFKLFSCDFLFHAKTVLTEDTEP